MSFGSRVFKALGFTTIVGLSVGLAMVGSAQAGPIHFGVLGGLTMTSPSAQSNNLSIPTTAQAGFLLGANVEGEVYPGISIEGDVNYMRRVYELGSPATLVSSNWVQLPILARFEIFELLSLGIGPYLAFGVSDYIVGDYAVPAETVFRDKFEAGGVTSFRAGFPIVPKKVVLVVDLRFDFAFNSLDNSVGAGNSFRHLGFEFLGGLKFNPFDE